MNNLIPSVCIDAVFESKSFEEACDAVKRANVFKAIRETHFHGFVGLKYWPLEANPVVDLKEEVDWLR